MFSIDKILKEVAEAKNRQRRSWCFELTEERRCFDSYYPPMIASTPSMARNLTIDVLREVIEAKNRRSYQSMIDEIFPK
jgi:hypothetical protein